MRKITVSSIELTILSEEEFHKMGGPGIGDVAIDDGKILESIIVDNFTYAQDTNLLFFVKYHGAIYQWYFTINCYNFSNKTTYEFTRQFDAVYLGDFVNKHTLNIYHTFVGISDHKRLWFDLNEEEYWEVD